MVNEKLKFAGRVVMFGLVIIMTAEASKSIKGSANNPVLLTAPDSIISSDLSQGFDSVSDSAVQSLSDYYYFTLTTYGEWGDDLDVTYMYPKRTASNSYVEGIGGEEGNITIWPVGHDREGFHNLEYCRDCSGGHTYIFNNNCKIYMLNNAYQNGYGYTGIAGQFIVEQHVSINGKFDPDYEGYEVYELQ